MNYNNADYDISLDIFLTNISIGVIFTTENGIITKINPHAQNLFRYAEDQILGESITKLIPSISQSAKEIDLSKPKTYFEIVAVKEGGKPVLVDITINYFTTTQQVVNILLIRERDFKKNSENRFIQSSDFVLQEDIYTWNLVKTRRAIANRDDKAYNFFINIWNYVEVIIFVTDHRGTIKMFNPNAERRLGYQAENIVDNQNLLELFEPQELAGRKQKLMRELDKVITDDLTVLTLPTDLGLPNEFEITLVRKDGTKFPVLISINKIGNLHTEGYIGIARDISDKQSTERELINNLEKEKELSDLRFRLLSLASHEFKTPLNVILFSTSIISKYNKTEDQPQREKHLQRITKSVNSLNDLLNDLLSVSKLEKGIIELKNSHFSPKEYMKDIIEESSIFLKNGQKIQYKHVGKNLAFLNSSIFKQIVVNLISNAIKFSPESSKITVRSEVVKNTLILIVKDNGYGVPEEDQSRLFARFNRGSNVGDIEGSGLGLYIISVYLELMNGKLDFNSKLNIGTEVKISFPMETNLTA